MVTSDVDNERHGGDCWLIAAQSLAIAASMISVSTLAVLRCLVAGITGVMITLIFANYVGFFLFEILRRYMQRPCVLDIAGGLAVILSANMLVIKTAYPEEIYMGLGAIVGANLCAYAAFFIVFINPHKYRESLVTVQCLVIAGFLCSVPLFLGLVIDTGYIIDDSMARFVTPLIVANTVRLVLMHTILASAMVDSFNWAFAALKMFFFVRSDQNAKWIKEHKKARAFDWQMAEVVIK